MSSSHSSATTNRSLEKLAWVHSRPTLLPLSTMLQPKRTTANPHLDLFCSHQPAKSTSRMITCHPKNWWRNTTKPFACTPTLWPKSQSPRAYRLWISCHRFRVIGQLAGLLRSTESIKTSRETWPSQPHAKRGYSEVRRRRQRLRAFARP